MRDSTLNIAILLQVNTINQNSFIMLLKRIALLSFFLPLFTYAQNGRVSADLYGGVYMPFPGNIAADLDGETHRAKFGWPELDGNLYVRVLDAQSGDKSFIDIYGGGTYRNMFGLEELADGRDFEGDMSMRQFRVGAKFFDLVRVSYVYAGINAAGVSEGVFQTFTYGGPMVWQNGYDIGLEAKQGINSVGLYFQSSFNPPASTDERAVQWSIVDARIRSELLKGETASGFVQLNFGYDQMSYDNREASDNRNLDYTGFRVGAGIGVAF